MYFYRVVSDSCNYVVERDGKAVLMFQASMDCCEYGSVAVDRATGKSYWFSGEKRMVIFKEFVQDEQIHPTRLGSHCSPRFTANSFGVTPATTTLRA